MGMNQSAMQETRVPSLGQEDTLEEGMATHSSIVVWRTPWTWSLVGYIPWGCKELDTTEQLTLSFSLSHTHTEAWKMTTSCILSWIIGLITTISKIVARLDLYCLVLQPY